MAVPNVPANTRVLVAIFRSALFMEVQFFNKEEIKKLVQSPLAASQRIKAIIEPLINPDLADKQRLEICHLGKFLALFDDDFTNIVKSESPDFILKYQNQLIGLEVESIKDEKIASKNGSLSKLCKEASKVFQERYPEINLFVTIYFNEKGFVFQKSDSEILINDIINFIYGCYSNEEVNKPVFIESIYMLKGKKTHFLYNEGGFYVNNLTLDILQTAIRKKEKKVNSYKLASCTDIQWLLLTIGAPTSDSYEYGDFPFQMTIDSKFSRIFLMEDTNERFWILK